MLAAVSRKNRYFRYAHCLSCDYAVGVSADHDDELVYVTNYRLHRMKWAITYEELYDITIATIIIGILGLIFRIGTTILATNISRRAINNMGMGQQQFGAYGQSMVVPQQQQNLGYYSPYTPA